MADECKEKRDTCGSCRRKHCTNTCSIREVQCVSCNVNTHASWDRQCLSFLQKCKEHDRRHLETCMPYFMTTELWTQVMLLPKPPAYIRPDTRTMERPLLQQTTLNFRENQPRRTTSKHNMMANKGGEREEGEWDNRNRENATQS